MEPEVDSRLVSLKNGKWQASNGPLNISTGWAKPVGPCWPGAVNHWHMPAAELVRPFRVLPDWRLGRPDDLLLRPRRRCRPAYRSV